MAGKIKGIVIEIGGDTQKLNKALEDVNKKTRDVQSELRQVERLLKLDPKNTELLAQKQKLLAEAVENSREKLDRLKTAQEQVNEQFRKGEINEEQYRAFQREVVKAEQELSKFEKQLRETGLTAEQVGKKMQDLGGKIEGAGKKLLPLTGIIAGAGGVAFKMAADMDDAVGATEQIFGEAADSVKAWADKLAGYYGIAEGEALEYANMMGTMLVNIGGLTEREAAKQAQTLIELAGDLTAMYGGTTADAVRALTGALKGNNTMLDNYGMAVNDAMIKTQALEMGLIKEGEALDLSSKQAATLALIMEQTGAAQGQAAREAEGASGSMRTLTTEVKNLATDLGEVLLPIITPIIQKVSEFVQWLGSLDDGTKKTIVTIAGIVAALGPVLIIIGNLISAIGTIMTVIKSLIAIKKIWTAVQAALNVVLSANPIGLIIMAIAALIAIIVLCVKHWDEIKAALEKVWNWIKETAVKVWESISNFFANIWERIKEVFFNALNKVVGFFTNTRDKIRGIWDGITGTIKGAVNNIIGHIENMVNWCIKQINWFIGAVNKAIDVINKIPGVNIGKIKLLGEVSIPRLAEGGDILRSGWALVGERGPELLNLPRGAQVQPLDAGRTENNYYLSVTIPAKDIEEMRSVWDFFRRAKQEARTLNLSEV